MIDYHSNPNPEAILVTHLKIISDEVELEVKCSLLSNDWNELKED